MKIQMHAGLFNKSKLSFNLRLYMGSNKSKSKTVAIVHEGLTWVQYDDI